MSLFDTAKYVEFKECRFKGINAVAERLEVLEATNVVFDKCDLSGASIIDSSLNSVRFVGCRMSGIEISSSTLNDVSFEQCRLQRAQFTQAKSASEVAALPARLVSGFHAFAPSNRQ